MEILRIGEGMYVANCYVVYSKSTMEGVIIDPGGGADNIISAIEDRDIKVVGIVLTHGHGDHIGGLNGLKEKYDVDIMIHEADSDMLSDANINLSNAIPMNKTEIKADRFLKDGDTIDIGDEKILVIHTPGHTRGGISLKIGDNIFTGDTLFQGSIGRTDLYGGNFNDIIKSIKSKLLIYDDHVTIYPGHGESSTIGYERMRNPFLQ